MKAKNILLKKSILNRMSAKAYHEMVSVMADDIYNQTEYDVVIPVARKCFNLYQALLPLVKEERDGAVEEVHQSLERNNGNSTIVLTDLALDWVIWKIRTGSGRRIRSILLLDDVIIHGRTLCRIKKRLIDAFKEAGIPEDEYRVEIATFAVNTEGLKIEQSEIANLSNVRKCTTSEWRLFSGKIVDMIYLSGQTYTSYVPKLTILMDSDAGRIMKQFIAQREGNGLVEISDPARKNLGFKIYTCAQMSEASYALYETYRIYEFISQGKYVFIPMVSLRTVNQNCLSAYVEKILELELLERRQDQEADASVRDFLRQSSGEYQYRLVLYVASAFAGWNFLRQKIGITDILKMDYYDRNVEDFTFYYLGIKSYSDLCAESGTLPDLSGMFAAQYEQYMPQKEIEKASKVIADDEYIRELTDSMTVILNEEHRGAERIEMPCNSDEIGKLLTINHQIDERLCSEAVKKDGQPALSRINGIPLADIVSMLIQKGGRTLQQALTAVIKTIDFGKGSIVPHAFMVSETEGYYTSLIHAGEENYQYYIDQYLPVLYGLCMLEFRGNTAPGISQKQDYLNRFYQEAPSTSTYLALDREILLCPETLLELRDTVYEAAIFRPMDESTKDAFSRAVSLTKEYM